MYHNTLPRKSSFSPQPNRRVYTEIRSSRKLSPLQARCLSPVFLERREIVNPRTEVVSYPSPMRNQNLKIEKSYFRLDVDDNGCNEDLKPTMIISECPTAPISNYDDDNNNRISRIRYTTFAPLPSRSSRPIRHANNNPTYISPTYRSRTPTLLKQRDLTPSRLLHHRDDYMTSRETYCIGRSQNNIIKVRGGYSAPLEYSAPLRHTYIHNNSQNRIEKNYMNQPFTPVFSGVSQNGGNSQKLLIVRSPSKIDIENKTTIRDRLCQQEREVKPRT